MRTIYLVNGHTGEWEDARTWTAKAFTKKKSAVAYCNRLTVITSNDWEYDVMEKALKKIDKFASVDYTGTSYSISTLKVSNA